MISLIFVQGAHDVLIYQVIPGLCGFMRPKVTAHNFLWKFVNIKEC